MHAETTLVKRHQEQEGRQQGGGGLARMSFKLFTGRCKILHDAVEGTICLLVKAQAFRVLLVL